MRPHIYLFDADRNDLRGRESQLRTLGGDFEVSATTSRNQFLDWLYRDATSSPRKQSVSLIDAKASAFDLEAIGLRLIETIRRHPTLHKATRPILWIDSPSRELATTGPAMARAEAVLDDEWIDREDGRPLAEVVEWAGGREPRDFDRASEPPRLWSDEGGPAGSPSPKRDLELSRERDQMFQRQFDSTPTDLAYAIVWGIADELELAFLDWYLGEVGLATSERAARKKREQLQSALMDERDELDNAHASYIREAKRFIASSPLQTLNPLFEVSWPRLSHLSDLIQSLGKEQQEITRLAFMDPEIVESLKGLLLRVGPTGDKKTRERFELIQSEVGEIAAESGISEGVLYSRLQHAAHSLDDAHDDFLAHGPPRLDN